MGLNQTKIHLEMLLVIDRLSQILRRKHAESEQACPLDLTLEWAQMFKKSNDNPSAINLRICVHTPVNRVRELNKLRNKIHQSFKRSTNITDRFFDKYKIHDFTVFSAYDRGLCLMQYHRANDCRPMCYEQIFAGNSVFNMYT